MDVDTGSVRQLEDRATSSTATTAAAAFVGGPIEVAGFVQDESAPRY
jgi:hypothetical protein